MKFKHLKPMFYRNEDDPIGGVFEEQDIEVPENPVEEEAPQPQYVTMEALESFKNELSEMLKPQQQSQYYQPQYQEEEYNPLEDPNLTYVEQMKAYTDLQTQKALQAVQSQVAPLLQSVAIGNLSQGLSPEAQSELSRMVSNMDANALMMMQQNAEIANTIRYAAIGKAAESARQVQPSQIPNAANVSPNTKAGTVNNASVQALVAMGIPYENAVQRVRGMK